ncbi:hypothetical protein HF078_06900 [Bacillus sp. RO2]|uniref:hypothetical protein n=1 Tax=Bacillus sp. RO2 TaxID=2723913 RepID=UPI00145F2670|nr:hypothetical protein [Bacillus sp. RO2]NMH72794.1 hypothetical protein [Bacillus sp. RO2]
MKFTIDVSTMIRTEHRLKKDGSFKKFTGAEEKELLEDDMTFDSYNDAKYWKSNTEYIEVEEERIEVNPIISNLTDPHVSIRPHRTGKPRYSFFSEEELKEVLLSGDDSTNNSLIVDFEGKLHLIPFEEAKTRGYAARFETYMAGNGYVGARSSLNHITDTYLSLLEAWSIHLSSHDMIYRDYPSSHTKEQLISEIKEKISKL